MADRRRFMILAILLLVGCTHIEVMPDKTPAFQGKRIMYVDSYHEGYAWSDGIIEGLRSSLNGTGADLKTIYMDTKRNGSEDFKVRAGILAKQGIDAWDPDLLIACDDNAFQYLVMPYYRDASLPVVFCGINWDASAYGAPYSNTAGMIEVSHTTRLVELIRGYSNGSRIAFLSVDTETEHKNLEYYEGRLNITFTRAYFVTGFDQWKDRFVAVQDEADMVILENNAGIPDWDNAEAEQFVLDNTRIPAGATNEWMIPYALIGLTKVPQEQGEWSGMTALEILNGTAPYKIPIARNKEGRFSVNLKIAKKLDAFIEPSLLREADVLR
jgi:hypothetical protein